MSEQSGARAPVADAMDRVLEAEHAARQSVAECERQTSEAVARAREQRGRVLERARARAAAVRARAEDALRTLARGASEAHERAAAAMIERLSDPARRAAALDRLVTRLIDGESEREAR